MDQIRKPEDQIVVKGRIVMLDMHNANPAAIDDVRSIVKQHGGVIDLSGIHNVGRIVRMMPPDAEAAVALGEWLERADSLLDASALDLSQADLSGADLAMALLTQTVLRNAKLVGTDLYRAHLQGAVLDEADLSAASLVKVELDEASLRGATVNAADLGGASLWAVDARAASFRATWSPNACRCTSRTPCLSPGSSSRRSMPAG
ncbi:pentapeptide repeat-containing protein [Streptomyces sp. NPDC127063]|uniref:pentapeptide repeat-containing protein n=1 Tax=Streptomyces sp. NPDC127063 TaxID=3347123 RepID=UPI003666D473